ncbi:hypothetical protein [Psychrobacter sp. WY6]|uniref:hypothetical protein n=1 Tax=Psychrobacter sp. WY6 TaxID=2708350 RepID=UPI002022F5CD|nr:hypothetical protein [Psychrobacter sp. WY6]
MSRDSSAFISLPVSIDSYIRMIDPLYFGVFIHSLWMAGITTIICLLLGYPFAWLIAKAKTRWQPLLMMLLILPFWTNSLVRTYALKLLFANNGLINKSLLAIGIIDTPIDFIHASGGDCWFDIFIVPIYGVAVIRSIYRFAP